jgi:hypothetical protein
MTEPRRPVAGISTKEKHMNVTKQQLLNLVLARRDAGTINGKFLKKIRRQALALMFATRRGDFMDVDLLWIAAGCPKGKAPQDFLNSPAGREKVEDLAEELGVEPSDIVVTDDRTVN